MNEIRNVIIAGWIAMFGSVILSILGADIIVWRAFELGLAVLILTIAYTVYGWWAEYRREHPKVRGQD